MTDALQGAMRFEADEMARYVRLQDGDYCSISDVWKPLQQHFYLCLRSRLHPGFEDGGENALSRDLYHQLPYSLLLEKRKTEFQESGKRMLNVLFGQLLEWPCEDASVDANLRVAHDRYTEAETNDQKATLARKYIDAINHRLRYSDVSLPFERAVATHNVLRSFNYYEMYGQKQGDPARPLVMTPPIAGTLGCDAELDAHLANLRSKSSKYEKEYGEKIAALDRIFYSEHGTEVHGSPQKSKRYLYLPLYDRGIFFAVFVGVFDLPGKVDDGSDATLLAGMHEINNLLREFAVLAPLIVRKVKVRGLQEQFNFLGSKSHHRDAIFDQMSRLNASYGLNQCSITQRGRLPVIQFRPAKDDQSANDDKRAGDNEPADDDNPIKADAPTNDDLKCCLSYDFSPSGLPVCFESYVPDDGHLIQRNTPAPDPGLLDGLMGIFGFGGVSPSQKLRIQKDVLATDWSKVPGFLNADFNYIRSDLVEFLEHRALQTQITLVGLISQNLSHNLGSHVLADPDLVMEHTKPAQIREIHQYLQGRMDYVAQLVTKHTPEPEPLNLLGDVMNDFFAQDRLLDCLIADRGFRGVQISFSITDRTKESSATVQFIWRAEEGYLPDQAQNDLQHFLVGVPGGRVGRHALFTIIENIMRNSAKYGRSRHQANYHFTMELSNPVSEADYCLLELKDNFSGFGTDEEFGKLRELFEQEVMTETGLPNSRGQGMLEIREAMRFLYHDIHWRPTACRRENCDGKCDANLCNCDQKLTFRIRLRRPRLLGLWDPFFQTEGTFNDYAAGVYTSRRLDLFTKYNHHVFVVLDRESAEDDTTKMDGIVHQLAENHWHLPFRVLILTQGGRLAAWKTAIEKRTSLGVDESGHIPARRFAVAADQDLHTHLRSVRDRGRSELFTIVNDVYIFWLHSYKQSEQPWHLTICFDREGGEGQGNVQAKWGRAVAAFNGTSPDSGQQENRFVKLAFHSIVPKGEAENHQLPADRRTSILYFNHDVPFSWRDITDEAGIISHPDRLAFSQRFGAVANLGAFQYLENPPTDFEAFRFYIYGLVEAAMIRIAIFDERVAGPLLVNGSIMPSRIRELARTGIYPIVNLRQADGSCASVRQDCRAQLDAQGHYSEEGNLEGIAPCDQKSGILLGGELVPANVINLDVLVLHEGNIDEAVASKQLDKGFEKAYLCWIPALRRTSGKGPVSRKLDPRLPFVESSLITHALTPGVYRDEQVFFVDKVTLTKGVLNAFQPKCDKSSSSLQKS